MTIPFRKMNGLGNDFVVLDARPAPLAVTGPIAAKIADRKSGVGCDQLIVMEPAEEPADVFMRIFNQDGGEVAACGNATRCVADLIMAERGCTTVRVETKAGLLRCTRTDQGISVDMGVPKFDWQDIPLTERMDTRLLDIKLGPIDAPVLFGPSAVNVGNPHCIFFVEDVKAHDLEKIGPLIEFHPLFPEQANVSLAQVTAGDSIRLRVWERGVGTTRACGTAACAVVPAAVRKNLTARHVTVTLDGGPLDIVWRDDDHIVMTGPAELEYEGTLAPALFEETR